MQALSAKYLIDQVYYLGSSHSRATHIYPATHKIHNTNHAIRVYHDKPRPPY